MITVVQRVSRAEVRVGGEVVGRIDRGLLALVAVLEGDGSRDVELTARKLRTLRVFDDGAGRMNRSLQDVGGAALLVSQFTLAGDTRKGRRPSFTGAAAPEEAEGAFDALVAALRDAGVPVEAGVFGATMDVELVNDGPVTLILDSWETRRGGRRRPGETGSDGEGNGGEGNGE